MDLATTLKTLSLGILMMSSAAVVLLVALALIWLRTKRTGYWLRFMLFGVGLYNALFSLLLLLNIVGIRQTSLGEIFFYIYVTSHLFQASAIGAFMLYMLGVLPDRIEADAHLV